MILGKNMKKVFRIFQNDVLITEGGYGHKRQISVLPVPSKGINSVRQRIIYEYSTNGTLNPDLLYEVQGFVRAPEVGEILIYKFWVKNGVVVNNGTGPGHISYTLDGGISEEQWFVDGQEASITTPYSSKVYRKSGEVKSRWMYGNEDITNIFNNFLEKTEIEVDNINKTDIDVFILERGILR